MIQLIRHREIRDKFNGNNLKVSSLSSPKSLDEFDINVVDLRGEVIWSYYGNSTSIVNCINDLENIKVMIENCKKTKLVVILPQNCSFSYDRIGNTGQEYYRKKHLKNILSDAERIIKSIVDISRQGLVYENTVTGIGEYELEASFYFNQADKVMTKSNKSEKITTVKIGDKTCTTLDIRSYEQLNAFLRQVKLIDDKSEVPEWIHDIEMFDDKRLKADIVCNTEKIKEAEKLIEQRQIVLDKNNEYKSILYTNSDELVCVVFEILEEILKCDLKDFKDEKNEDFLIKKDTITFIGEIKGVTTNVKSEYISQLDVHLQSYLDKLEDENRTVKVKSLLIINHQRKQKLELRQPVHETQIALAKRNESLIIETITLLKIYEKYKEGELTHEKIEKMFSERVGLLVID